MSFKLSKLVEIDWEDACAQSGWSTTEDYLTLSPSLCRTVGYLLKKTDEAITVAMTQSCDDTINQAISIPTGWIKKIRTIR